MINFLHIISLLSNRPGSSKSLAKTLVDDVLQGANSYSELFRTFKEIHIVSFQCSPLATADGILSTFRQCQKYQEKRELDKFTAVAVLDEVGLAEDSTKMPLKALHPLLEDGTIGDEQKSAWKKVSCNYLVLVVFSNASFMFFFHKHRYPSLVSRIGHWILQK